ncbi:COP23 domain-containing protein [Chamaesiphon polymorphus]|uniref:Uncharacterized protein n=1 Tax=Chamaesiphon polymorphus CCALA 037 TaxID=2107692 RepID=A0A2T1GCJ2_9CYAN|nr:COP23 domain-containing protein [Chamaesiphon polymorphus]PSB55079.1 hypothetical protein C7B77_16175 [Chamaesiphon polymorphus CCALA 037]
MKILCYQIALSFTIASLPLQPTLAQPQHLDVAFYCGRVQIQDSGERKMMPATVVQVKGTEGERTLVVWKNGFKNMSPLERCETVSKRFQAAWQRGDFKKFAPQSNNKNGLGILCALSFQGKACTEKDILFTVKNANEANKIVADLYQSLQNATVGRPIYQSSSSQSIDMQELINGISNSTDK